MFVLHVGGGRTPSYSDILKRPKPVYKILEILPYELIEVVVLHVTAIKDLRSLALVNKLFQELAEPRIYKHVLIRQGSQAKKLATAVRNKPIRATWVRTLQNACRYNSFNGLPELPSLVPMMTKLEDLVVETPDCNSVEPENRRPWIAQQFEYNDIFLKAALLSAGFLPSLRSCTLHFVDKHRSLYSLGLHSIIFLHPTLTSLTISCANIDPPKKLHPLLLNSNLANTTPLTTLNLTECDIDPEGLYHLLRIPCTLISLTITEANHYVFYIRDHYYSGLSTPNALHPIATCQPHLRHLRIARLRYDKKHLLSIPPLDLTPFTSLHSVEYAHVQNPRWNSPEAPNWCDLVHRAGPQMNTGAPNTTTLMYSDIPSHWWGNSIQFFKCAFSNKISHGIEKLRILKLILIDDELLIEQGVRMRIDEEAQREQENRRVAVEKVRRQVRELGVLGRKENVGVRVVVEWVRPSGTTIPPYLTGEYVPEVRPEYDSGVGLEIVADGGHEV